MHISKSLLKFLSAGFVLIFNLNSICDVVNGGDCAEALEELLGAVELEDSLVSNGYIPGALK